MFVLLGTTNAQIRIDDFHGHIIPSWCTLDGTSKYTLSSDGDSIFPIMNSNHQLEHTINLPRRWECTACYFDDMDYPGGPSYGYFTQNIFNEDPLYEYFSFSNEYTIELKNEEGAIIHTFSPDEGFRWRPEWPTLYRFRGQYVLISVQEENVNGGHWKTVWFKMGMQDRIILRIGSIDYVSYNQYHNGIISGQHTASDSPQLIHHDNDTITIYNSDLHAIHTFTTTDTVISIGIHDLNAMGSTTGSFSSRITQTLFNADNKYEYVTCVGKKIEIRNEDGITLYIFDCTGFENWTPSSLVLWKISGYDYAEITGILTADYYFSESVFFKLDLNTQNVMTISDAIFGKPTIVPAQFNTSGNHQIYLNQRILDSNLNPISQDFNVSYNNSHVTFHDLDVFDGSLYNGRPVLLTQTLFNNDELYEFVINNPHPSPAVEVKNENGDILHTFYLDDEFESFYSDCKIIKYGGKYYFVLFETDYDYIFDRRTIWYLMDTPTQSLTRVDEPLPITVYPTVASHEQIITVELEENNKTTEVQIINSLGHVEMIVPVQSGQNKVQLHINDLPSGMYIIRTLSKNGQQTNKIIVK